MGKKAHPLGIRQGIPSKSLVPYPRRPGENPFRREDFQQVTGNLQRGAYAKRTGNLALVEKTVHDICDRAGHLVARMQSFEGLGRINFTLTLYLRSKTSLNLLAPKPARTPSRKKGRLSLEERATEGRRGSLRRIIWTRRRGLSWRPLRKSDFAVLAKVFSTSFTKGVPIHFQIRHLQRTVAAEDERKVAQALTRFRRGHYFQDGLNIVSILQKEALPDLLASYMVREIGEVSYHRAFLQFVFEAMKESLKLPYGLLRGYHLLVTGRIDGSSRSRRMESRQGSIPLHTFSAPIAYAFRDVHTRYGTYSIKIWLCYI